MTSCYWEFSLLHCVPQPLGVLRLSFGVDQCFSLNCLFITCSAGRMRFTRIIPSSIGQEHIPTSEGRQPLLQPIFTPGIRCLRIHCGSVMVSKFTTLWRSGVPCLALSPSLPTDHLPTSQDRVDVITHNLHALYWTNNISV